MDRLTSKPTPLAGFILFVVGLAFLFYIASPSEDVRSLELGEARELERRAARAEVDALGAAELSSYGVIDATSDRYRLSIDRAMGLMVRDWRTDSQRGRKEFLDRVERIYPSQDAGSSAPADVPSLESFE